MTPDHTALEKSLGQLEKSLGYLNSEAARGDTGLREQFRTATIKAFENTYACAVAAQFMGRMKQILEEAAF